jgi:hypothetical protein
VHMGFDITRRVEWLTLEMVACPRTLVQLALLPDMALVQDWRESVLPLKRLPLKALTIVVAVVH